MPALPRSRCALALLALALLAVPAPARATPYRLTPADRAEITQLLRSFFEAARDGNLGAVTQLVPTRAEMGALFVSGTEPFIERHQRAVERDVRELRTRFAGGVWVGVAGAFARQPALEVAPCGRFGAPASECAAGPVIDWRVGTQLQHLRIDRLVRVNGHWKIFDPRL